MGLVRPNEKNTAGPRRCLPLPPPPPPHSRLNHLEYVGLQVRLPPRVSLPSEDVTSAAQLRRRLYPPTHSLQRGTQGGPRGAQDLVRAVSPRTLAFNSLYRSDSRQVAGGFHLACVRRVRDSEGRRKRGFPVFTRERLFVAWCFLDTEGKGGGERKKSKSL